MQSFIPGQRWISDTESDLGLGTILKTEHRLVTIVYMASGEIRTYSSESAPLTRVQFASGDRIRSADERTLIVNDVEEIDGLLAYHGTTDEGASATLSETELDNFMQFNRPLGKTIEAGMIIHRQLVRDQISRVLVIVPEPLLHQWLVEMKRRFNLNFSIVDELMYAESLESATEGNPFLDRQLVLTTLPVLLSDPKIEAHALMKRITLKRRMKRITHRVTIA